MDEDNCMVDDYIVALIFVKGNNQFDKRGLSEMIVSAKNFKNLDRYWLWKFERKKALLREKQRARSPVFLFRFYIGVGIIDMYNTDLTF